MTFVDENIETKDQVLIAVLTAAYNNSGDIYGYKISQSSGQTGDGQVGNQTVIEDILGKSLVERIVRLSITVLCLSMICLRLSIQNYVWGRGQG